MIASVLSSARKLDVLFLGDGTTAGSVIRGPPEWFGYMFALAANLVDMAHRVKGKNALLKLYWRGWSEAGCRVAVV